MLLLCHLKSKSDWENFTAAVSFGMPLLRVRNVQSRIIETMNLDAHQPSQNLKDSISGPIARMYELVPFELTSADLLVLAIAECPAHEMVDTEDELEFALGRRILLVPCPRAEVVAAVERLYPPDKDVSMGDVLREMQSDFEKGSDDSA